MAETGVGCWSIAVCKLAALSLQKVHRFRAMASYIMSLAARVPAPFIVVVPITVPRERPANEAWDPLGRAIHLENGCFSVSIRIKIMFMQDKNSFADSPWGYVDPALS